MNRRDRLSQWGTQIWPTHLKNQFTVHKLCQFNIRMQLCKKDILWNNRVWHRLESVLLQRQHKSVQSKSIIVLNIQPHYNLELTICWRRVWTCQNKGTTISIKLGRFCNLPVTSQKWNSFELYNSGTNNCSQITWGDFQM